MTQGFVPGNFVRLPAEPDWGVGQIQSVVGERVTVNFENAGKRIVLLGKVELVPADPTGPPPRGRSDS